MHHFAKYCATGQRLYILAPTKFELENLWIESKWKGFERQYSGDFRLVLTWFPSDCCSELTIYIRIDGTLSKVHTILFYVRQTFSDSVKEMLAICLYGAD